MRIQLLLLIWMIISPLSPAFSQSDIDFSKIDKYAQKAPREVTHDLNLLADYLVRGASSDIEKARAIYVWITHHIKYDYQAYKNGNKRINRNNLDVLRRQKAVCYGYSTLFKALCEEMEVEAELISGYSWDTLTSTENPDEPDHAWNAVKIDTIWYLLDATWGSSTLDRKNTFLKNDNQDYFLVDPKSFILSHLPQDPMWQLLDCPIGLNTFFSERVKMAAVLASKEQCFDFRDSIAKFLSLPVAAQKIKRAENAARFNPSPDMKAELASTYIDQAGILSDQVEKMDQEKDAIEIIKLQDQMIQYFRKAVPLSELYNWQWELFIGTLINQAVISYNTRTAESTKEVLEYSISLLEEAQKLLPHSSNTFFKDQAEQRCLAYLKALQTELKNLE